MIEISTRELLQLASGDRLSIQVYKFIGKFPGKKAYLQANLHGAEIVGNAVIHQLIEYLSSLDASQINGEIWLVPVCNPLGTNQRTHFFSTGRFNPHDGKDWNRIFWDYEKECDDLNEFAQSQINLNPQKIRTNYLAKIQTAFAKQLAAMQKPSSVPYNLQYRYQLQSLCLDANYVIDIHSSSVKSIDYLYCFHSREDSARYFLLPYGILMNKYDGEAFDEAFMKPWLALEKKLGKFGKKIQFDVESWTLELGSGMEMNPESVKKGVLGIKNYLLHQGILNLNIAPATTEIILIEKSKIKSYYAPTGGMIKVKLSLGSKVKSGEKLYEILSFNKTRELPRIIEVFAEENGLLFDISRNEAVNQGEYVLGIMNDG
ncbi:MAG: succinylglutamate desuccinylase/aspartoacylase family protein [Gomphosphaeria aponina SAG 52.96 = DSM 107014]|uniref:Succinylglutamate desuccinylase/aspartoacylase family protein n=1 Tax=Gomphosphaeria aponina SAG 52.96 = DSM 107014 TaxID=1521640 RepID=A0A941JV69_9CHRO|nr:succinylglutamate desuccinylase/aspartoacylase family protein [Gomphosphaeria aponina SAG 52.96 = DSM 107014]